MAFYLLLLLLPLVASNYLSLNYRNSSTTEDTHILLTTNYLGGTAISYTFSMSNPVIPISGDGSDHGCQYNQQCIYVTQLGKEFKVVLNSGSSSNYSFSLMEDYYFNLRLTAEGCEQDVSTFCRYANFTNGHSTPMGFVCMCDGYENFCTNTPQPLWVFPECTDTSTSPTTPAMTGFELSVIYGTSHGAGSFALDIIRRPTGPQQIEFAFVRSDNVINIKVNDESICSSSTVCGSVFISVGDSFRVTVADAFTFDLIQSSWNRTDVEYEGCPSTISNGTCQDTENGLSFYGCLCGGKTTVCNAPTSFNTSCFEPTFTASPSTPSIPSTPTSPTSPRFPTTSPTPEWKLHAFFSNNMENLVEKIEIIRTSVTPTGANFSLYSLTGESYNLDGVPETTNVSKHLSADSRMDIYVANYVFHFYLYENRSTTFVGIGDGSCPQDLSTSCKAGQISGSGYGCLCENMNDCSSPMPFDPCSATTSMSTSTPTLATISTPTSTSTSTSISTPTSISTSTSTSPFSSTLIISTSTSFIPTTNKNNDETTIPDSTSIPLITTTVTPIPIPTLKNLSDSTIGQNNVTQVLNDTLNYSNEKDSLTSDQIDDISVILTKSANVNGLNETDSILILTNLDNCLYASDNSINATTASRLNNVILPMVQNSNSASIDYLTGTNLGFSSRQVDCNTYGSDQGIMDNLTMFVAIQSSPESHLNAIQIPMASVCAVQQTGPKIYRTYNNHVWKDNKDGRISVSDGNSRVKRDTPDAQNSEAPSPCDRQTALATDSPVMSGTILTDGGSKILSRLDASQSKPVANLQFNIDGLLAPLHGKFVVTWWDNATQTWATSNECTTERKGYMIHATCPHLTDFTLVVSGSMDDPLVCNSALSITGYVANGLSIVSLSFLFVVYVCAFIPLFADTKVIKFMNGYAVAKRDSVSLSYTTSLLLFYLIFTIFATQDVAGNACSAMAAISYALFIATIIMNIFKCLRMMSRFIPGRSRNFFNFLQRAVVFDTISILVSFLISMLLLLLSDFFNRNDAYCWVRLDYIIFATVIPVSILVVNAAVATSLAAYRLFSTRMHVKKRGKHVDYNLGPKLANILILQFTLGMPWVLQFFTLALPEATAWHYAFTITLGSQGTVLALLFFYKRQRLLRSSRHAKKLASMATQATTVSNENSTSS